MTRRWLTEKGVDLLWDDRYESPGVKFKDADLIGIPYQLIVGARGLKEGKVELKTRQTKQAEAVDLDAAVATLLKEIHHAE